MNRIPYAMAGWLIAFLLWHVPFVFGWNPFDGEMNSVFHIYNLALILTAVAGTVVVLATVRPWGRKVPRWAVLIPLMVGCVLLVLRGVPGFVEFLAQVSGLAPAGFLGLFDESVEAPTGVELWAGYFVNLFFFVGALLLVPTTVRYWKLQPSRVD